MAAKEELQDEVPRCEFIHAHPETIKAVEENMPAEEELYALSELFKIFADSTRIRILYVLLEHEMCVCDLAQLLNMTQSAISHQLRILKQSRLVKFRREGKNHLLFPARRTCPQHFKSGHGAHHRIENLLITVSRIPRRLAPM